MPDTVTDPRFADFPATFKGRVLRAGESDFASARLIWNMLRRDENPAVIAQAADREDVAIAVAYANETGVPLAIHSGGHGIDGMAMPGDALVLDLSKLKDIDVDPERRLVTIEPGVLLGELDAAGQEHGLVVPAGVVSDTGATGLALGGGIGHLTRRFGATVDNIVSIEGITADGATVTASAESHPDLFWGLCGAGHNLAVVTSITFRAHPVGPRVMSGMMYYSADDAPKLFGNLDAVMAEAPRELSIALILLNAPPMPGLADSVVGTPVIAVLVIYTGDLARYEEATAGLRSLARPLVDEVTETTWAQANSIADPFEPPGRAQYLRGGYMSGIDADLAAVVLHQLASCPRTEPPSPNCLVTLPILGGAIFDRPEDATAFSRTGAEWLYEVSAHWDDPADDTAHLDWVHETDALLRRWATPNAYVNLTTHRGAEWLRRAYGTDEKWRRLVELKKAWDPDNRLAYNKNIRTAAEELGA